MTFAVFALVLLAAVLHALWNFAVRTAAGSLVVLWLAYWLGGLAILPFALGKIAAGAVLPWSGLRLMLVTGFVHTLYMFTLGKAYEQGEMSLVYPIARGTGVAGTALAAFWLFGEPITRLGGVGIAAVCVGTCLLGVSEFHRPHKVRAGLIALAVGFCIVAYSLIDSRGVCEIDPVIYIASPFLTPALLLTPYMVRRHGRRVRGVFRSFWKQVVLIGWGGLATYLIILFAFRKVGAAGYVVAVRESSVVFGAFLGFAVLRERLTWRRAAGVAAVAAGLALVKLAG